MSKVLRSSNNSSVWNLHEMSAHEQIKMKAIDFMQKCLNMARRDDIIQHLQPIPLSLRRQRVLFDILTMIIMARSKLADYSNQAVCCYVFHCVLSLFNKYYRPEQYPQKNCFKLLMRVHGSILLRFNSDLQIVS